MKKKKIVAIIMSVRNEESIIDLNILYHLDLGFDYIFIANHCSIDNTNKILKSYQDDSRVIVFKENNPVFDHAKISNKLLDFANKNYKIDWFIFLDADEFLSIKDKTIHDFVYKLEKNNIPYATIGWANALFDYTLSDYRCSPVHSIDTTKYFYPWPEKKWQEYGHFRKAIVKNHKNIEVVVGGHYVRTENNSSFFGDYNKNPFITPKDQARILHYEFRDKAEVVYEKWKKLASFEKDSTSDKDAPWIERIETIRKYVKKYKGKIDQINKRWFFEHRSFWGTIIPKDRIVYDITMSIWYRKYFRRKLENKEIKSVCLLRSGNLGDVIMTEPIARFLKKHVPKVCLATKIKNVELLLKTYNQIYQYNKVDSIEAINCDMFIKPVYELSDNKKTYIQGYMESIGFNGQKIDENVVIKNNWNDIIKNDYILIAPFTSQWEKKKRMWAYNKFIELSRVLKKEYKIKCIILDKKYSFDEMISLIKHCSFFIGNDSGPAIIARSFNKKSFVIFGATQPKYLMQASKNIIPIYDKNRHKLCNHSTRQEEIECCEEFCMDRISVDKVFKIIKLNL